MRDARWGRGAETPGECPTLTSWYAINYVRGMQGYAEYNRSAPAGSQSPPRIMRASSCLKHFFAYDGPEDWGRHGVNSSGAKTRFNFDARVTEQDLADTFLPAFEAGARPDLGAASGVMCSYNSVNGIPACAHKDALTTKLRESWGFRGYVTSDCGAIECVGPSCQAGQGHCQEIAPLGTRAYYACMNASGHNYSASPDQIIADVFKAGLDINCGSFIPPHLMKALADGAITRRDMNVALTHLFDVLMRLGLFETEAAQPLHGAGVNDVGTTTHRQISLDAAVQGCVLLTNFNETLPLVRAQPLHSVAVVGQDECKLGPYAATPRSNDKAHHCTVFDGLHGIGAMALTAVNNLSAACDQTTSEIVVAILDTNCLSESHDRQSIGPADDDAQALGHIADRRSKGTCHVAKPFVLVVLGACATDLRVAASAFDAVLWAGSGGERAGEAISRVLFGMEVPSGRLPITMYDRQIDQTSLFDMAMRPSPSRGYPGRTYRFHTGQQVFPAFHGLSYTTFSYTLRNVLVAPVALTAVAINADLRNASMHRFSAPPRLTITAMVTNTGARAAPVSVLAFVAGPAAGTEGEPIRELIGFEKLQLGVGQSAEVRFPLGAWELSSVDAAGLRRATRGKWCVMVGGAKHVALVQ